MKKLSVYSIILLIAIHACKSPGEELINYPKLTQFVNPFIGTGGHGHTYPGASAPFGFVQLSPDTRLEGWDGCGGYHYTDSIIYGFSHTHLSGTGVSDYGDLLLMPGIQPRFENGYQVHPDSGYASRFDHQSEKAEAGYYAVHLEDGSIDVQLTASKRCGFHHYRFAPDQTKQYVILDIEHRDKLLEGAIEILNDSTIRGKRISRSWAREQHVYYYIKFSAAFGAVKFNPDSGKAILEFSGKNDLMIKVGLSAVSTAGAQNNLKTEIPHWNFEQTKEETQREWNRELSKIQVEMPHDSDRVIFYTALYHSYLNPNIFQDQGGQYRGTDLNIHSSEDFDNYTIFSLWDTYRATHPLFTITQTEKTRDFIHTFLNQYKNGGKLPVWELAGNYTGCMIGYHSIPVIVDAYIKGITDFDTELALEAMLATANANELGKGFYANNGYAAMDEEHESVSKNLEYAYDDWCIAQFAKALGKDEVYREFIQRAQHYKNIFDPETAFMRGKRNQQFTVPFDPTEVNFNFTEANSWQYSFYVPQDVEGLIRLHGGQQQFEQKLDSLFSTSNQTSGRHQVDITGLVGQYAHGNEPSHHMAYLYNYVQQPHKTQYRISSLMDEMYSNRPDGLIGNEDCGQMSSWYVFSALGFYPVTPGSQDYIIGSPSVKKASIRLENGNTFEIEVRQLNKENPYIQQISLNGEDYQKSYLKHEDIMKGGRLVFIMGPKANRDWFTAHPLSQIDDHLITPVPYVKTEQQIFKDSLLIVLAHPYPDVEIYFALDEEEFQVYDKPFIIDRTCSIQIKAKQAESESESKIGNSKFYKLDQKRSVSYNFPYNPQYSAGGKDGLIDLIRGGSDFRTGYWQGFQGEDLEVIIQLDGIEEISHISSGYLQDINSWIWIPKSVSYSTSMDGKNYSPLKTLKHNIPTDQYGVFLHEFSLDVEPLKAKYVKLTAAQFGTIPDWHLGKGGASFIFIDEVLIR